MRLSEGNRLFDRVSLLFSLQVPNVIKVSTQPKKWPLAAKNGTKCVSNAVSFSLSLVQLLIIELRPSRSLQENVRSDDHGRTRRKSLLQTMLRT